MIYSEISLGKHIIFKFSSKDSEELKGYVICIEKSSTYGQDNPYSPNETHSKCIAVITEKETPADERGYIEDRLKEELLKSIVPYSEIQTAYNAYKFTWLSPDEIISIEEEVKIYKKKRRFANLI